MKCCNLCSEKNKDSNKQKQLQHHGHMKGHEETLLTIPGAVVNLLDHDKSQELERGEFSLVTLHQGDRTLAVYAKVGENLRWPLTKDEPTLKLDPCHYLFSIHTPPDAEEARGSAKSGAAEVLNFGVTFGDGKRLVFLDQCLKQHACLSLPSRSWSSCLPNLAAEEPNVGKDSRDSEVYWNDLAPKVEDYNSILAKAIAGGSGQIIKGMFVCTDAYSAQVRKGGKLFRKQLKEEPEKRKKSSEISPRVKKNILRVNKLSKMTEDMSNCVVQGVLITPVDVMATHSNSKCGRNCFTRLPAGDVVLASLDAYNKVLEAAQVAGKDAAKTTSEVTTEIITDRYGEDAGEVAKDTLEITGHAMGTAVNITKLTNPGLKVPL